ncbi:hypothetical protein [Rhodocista pekingensis]|uniref:Uncharacterized protein n=1 Tax=Rhodocista pekingensis TaxID=201185 RepID=A0ABW2KXP6_9PROT
MFGHAGDYPANSGHSGSIDGIGPEGRPLAPQALTADLVQLIFRDYFRIIGETYRTYCAFTTAINCRVLAQFGVAARPMPCQALLRAETGTFALGYLDTPPEGQWNGHVVTLAGDWLIDCTLAGFRRLGDFPVPDIAIVTGAEPEADVLASFEPAPGHRLLWRPPPSGEPGTVPQEPAAMVEEAARALIAAVTRELAERQGRA